MNVDIKDIILNFIRDKSIGESIEIAEEFCGYGKSLEREQKEFCRVFGLEFLLYDKRTRKYIFRKIVDIRYPNE